MNEIYDEYSELLGAYALDAVDADERERIERHLTECPRCRAEVADHREVAALLSQSGADAPEGVWGRIEAELSPSAPPMRLEVSAPTPIGDARGARSKTLLAVLAVAACIIAILGVVAISQNNRLNQNDELAVDPSIESVANDFVAHSEISASLEGTAGEAKAIVGKSGQGFLIVDELPAPADGSVYQLWGQVDDTVLSLGTFSDGSSVVPFSVDPTRLDDVKLFAVTQELAPGVVASKNDAVLVGEV